MTPEHIEAAETIRALRARVEALTAERDALHKDYQSACVLVADMHMAAVGKVTGPVLGVVEDVAAVRSERDAALQLAADRLVDAERLTRWILQRGNSLGDHACARCRPNSEIIKKGFSCAYHLAQDIAAAGQAAKDSA